MKAIRNSTILINFFFIFLKWRTYLDKNIKTKKVFENNNKM